MFDKYPYTDFHEMNLDWIIKEMKDLVDSWDSFGGNVSAEAHVSTEPEVSVQGDLKTGLNFDFGLVQGQRGTQGPRGPQGEQGPAGNGLEILDIYPTLAALQSAHPTGTPGDAYLVGSDGNYTLYIWSDTASAWSDGGSLTSPTPSNNAPVMDGTAAAGSSLLYSRADHVHPSDSSKLSKSNNDGVYAVVDGNQVMRVPSTEPSAGSIVEYDENGYVNGNNAVLNSSKLDGVAASANAYQLLSSLGANLSVLGLGADLANNTPTVKFNGGRWGNDGTMSDATSEVNFTDSFGIDDTHYAQSRISLAPASASVLGGVKPGTGIAVDSNGVISNSFANLDGVDLDTITYQYVGYCNSNCTNKATSASGLLISKCDENNTDDGIQVYVSTATTVTARGIWYREKISGTWGMWKRVDNYYQIGDVVTFTNNSYECVGAMGTGSANFSFVIQLPHPIAQSVTSVNFTNLNIRPFGISGQLMSGSVLTSTYNATATLIKESGAIRVQVSKADGTAFSETALTPLAIFFSGLSFTFA